MKNKKGFTLIELLAVIVILGIIMTIATTNVLKSIKQSKIKARYIAAKDITEIASAYLATNDENCVSVSYLIKKGYLNDDVTNPKSGENIKSPDELSSQQVCNNTSSQEQSNYEINGVKYYFNGFVYYVDTVAQKYFSGTQLYNKETSIKTNNNNKGRRGTSGSSIYYISERSEVYVEGCYKLDFDLTDYNTIDMSIDKKNNHRNLIDKYYFTVSSSCSPQSYMKEMKYKSVDDNQHNEHILIPIKNINGNNNYLVIKLVHGNQVNANTSQLTIKNVTFKNT